jgi:hypothetical protein
MAEPVGRTILVLNGRVYELPPSRATYLSGSVAWWGALALWGALVLGLGMVVGAGAGAWSAIGGVVCFLFAGVLVGSERYELATAVGASAIIWTSTGIAVYPGTDPAPGASALVLGVLGGLALVAGGTMALRRRDRSSVRVHEQGRC